MIPDSDLKVWSIRPNWKDGITETLEWLSDVLRNSYGVEQVRALRLSPRRTFEAKFNPVDQERAFFDLWLERLASDEFMLPLWHDAALLDTSIATGATVLPLDTRYREFEVGGMAIVAGDDAFTFDKVTIAAITDAAITVAAGGVTRDWPAGTLVHPLRRARLDDQSDSSAITSRVGEATLRFELNQANDIDEGAWDAEYGSYPIILEEPNRRENIRVTFGMETVLADNDVGLRELTDDAGRAFTLQNHLLTLVGREEHWAFRQMVYRLRGQQGAVWVPTFNADVELSRGADAGDTQIDVKQVGYAYTGGVIDGRAHLLIDGTIPREITAVDVAPSPTEERLILDSALGSDLPAGVTASFMDTCRLGSDSIEIKHVTDSDGVAESTLSFRAFRDTRIAPDPTNYPIAVAARSGVNCGSPTDGTCVPVLPAYDPEDPLAPTDPGGGGGGDDGGGPVTSSTYAAVIYGFVPSDFDPDNDDTWNFDTPDDFSGWKRQNPELAYRIEPLAEMIDQFPELAGKTNEWIPILPGLGSGPWIGLGSGPGSGLGGGMDWLYTGSDWVHGEYHDPQVWISAFGAPPYSEIVTYWDDAQTLVKSVRGRGTLCEYEDGTYEPIATLSATHGDGTYKLWFFDFYKYYKATY